MPLSVLRLEDRILFDAAAPAVIAQIAADASAQGQEAPGADAAQGDSSSSPASDAATSPPPPVQVLLVASNVDHAQQLAEAAAKDVIAITYDYKDTTLEQLQSMISEALNGRRANSISFATEGQSGFFYLLNDVYVTSETLKADASLANFWSGISDMLTEKGRVDLLGCNVAGSQGDDFGLLSTLDSLLGKDQDVAASTNMTGAGGDWILESGNIDASVYFNMDALSRWTSDLATFTVTSAANAGAGTLRQAILDSNATPGIDTIAFANGVGFTIASTITITATLPTLTEGAIIDGRTMPGYSFGSAMLTINFNNLAGFNLGAVGGSEVRGLQLIGSNSTGVSMSGGSNIIADNIIRNNTGVGITITGGTQTIYGNRIGTDISGTLDQGNTTHGISISGGTNHIIGGINSGERNLISGNNGNGILISSTASATIRGNYIGTDYLGTSAIGNTTAGITLSGTGGVIVGGTAAERNLISGNLANGVVLSGGTHTVSGNYIGTDVSGTLDLGNTTNGISITGGTNHVIGTSGSGNTISGNNASGISVSGTATALIRGNYIGTDFNAAAAIGNNVGITISSSGANTVGGTSTGERNVISGNITNGVALSGGTQTIIGNHIGTNFLGTAAIANGTNGIAVTAGADHVIGGLAAGQRNVISGNTAAGVTVSGTNIEAFVRGNYIGTTANGLSALGNTTGFVTTGTGASIVEGNIISANTIGVQLSAGTQSVYTNYIGLDMTGNAALANGTGVLITAGSSHNIGGILPGQGNTITGNTNFGIQATGGSALIRGNTIGITVNELTPLGNNTNISISSATAVTIGGNTTAHRNFIAGGTNGIVLSGTGHTVQGNYIGTNIAGNADFGAANYGILVTGGTGHNLGGTAAGQGNLISGNNLAGVAITGTATANIRGNLIGTNESGTTALGNGIGVDINSTGASTVGGTTALTRNIISGNTNGVILQAGTQSVTGNYIGVDINGTVALGNQFYGVLVTGGTNQSIGGTATTNRNIISSNGTYGVEVSGGTALIRANYIGTDVNGTAVLANLTGVYIHSSLSSTVGGTTTAVRNVISGNTTGVILANGTQTVSGNYIGVDAAGLAALANTGDGISVTGGASHSIGGTAATGRNVISGNGAYGIQISAGSALVRANFIGVDTTGNAILSNNIGVMISSADSSTIGGSTTATRNVISGNTEGIVITAGTQTVIGNFIGVDQTTGNLDLGNLNNGILIQGGSSHNIGGLTSAERNIISGNGSSGIQVTNGSAVIKANYIGTNSAGNAVVGNTIGININTNASAAVIGGATTGERNLISGNTDGIQITTGTTAITGNYIGVNAAGTGALANTNDGVLISGGTNHIIGGLTTGERNIISGNTNAGIEVTADVVQITGNYIGTNASGEGAIANGVGIIMSSSMSNTIGGYTASARNLISGNVTGIDLSGAVHTVVGNYIGTDDDGVQDVGNTQSGIYLSDGNHIIGGGIAGSQNVISGNDVYGIDLAATTYASIQGNLIGTNNIGEGALANGVGINLASSATSTVGGSTLLEHNIISGNSTSGIIISDGTQNITGNYVGTDDDGLQDVGNVVNGINITGGINHNIAGNVISGNNSAGVVISGTASALLLNNIIGLNYTGTGVITNPTGVSVSSTSTSIIGGTVTDRNIISGNTNGIVLSGGLQNVSFNYIGTDIGGSLDLGNTSNGVNITGGSHNLFGNTISGNNTAGVAISGTASAVVHGNIIGLNASGSGVVTNATGITISSSSTSIIGGSAASERNIISGNTNGIVVSAGMQSIEGNYIGTDIGGVLDLGNTANGVNITGGTSHTLVDNVISGNNTSGVAISTTGSAILHKNIIGLDFSGNITVANATGVIISSTASSNIGGVTATERNVISGNTNGIVISAGTQTVEGNYIGTDAGGTIDLGNASNGIQISGGTSHLLTGNVISGNNGSGVILSGSSTALIRGNTIGLDYTGSVIVANATGVTISSTASSTIGGATATERNVISGNTNGIVISAGTQTVEGNYIGTDTGGTIDLGNASNGIQISGGTSHLLTGNVISGNNGSGVILSGSSTALIRGNTIGLDYTGSVIVANATGVTISSTASSTIGGATATERNVISGNTNGIVISAGTQTVEGNYIGTDAGGTIDLGNTSNGIQISGGTSHLLTGNVISGNNGSGIIVTAGNATIVNNLIGLSADGLSLIGNLIGITLNSVTSSTLGGVNLGNVISGNGTGILILNGSHFIYANQTLANTANGIEIYSSGNQVGGASAGEANMIANNGGNGVLVDAGTQNSILRNSIYNNSDLGIRLINLGNNDQVAPTIESATYDPLSDTLTIKGTFDGTIGTNYSLEFFSNSSDTGPNFQGKTYIGTLVLLATGPGTAFAFNIVGAFPVGTAFTSTATNDTSGDTSQFSNAKIFNTVPVEVVNTGIVVTTMETAPIKADNLTYIDAQESPSQIVYLVTTPPSYGQLELANNPNVPILSFTQADINAGLLVFRQNGSPVNQDQFIFTVTDGQGGEVANQVFHITVVKQQVAQPVWFKNFFDPRRPLLANYTAMDYYRGTGFFSVQGINQLTSFGNFVGFNQLALVSNSISFGFADGEPQLSNHSREFGYAEAVSALNYVYEYAGFKSGNPIVQEYIQDLAGGDELNFSIKNQTNT